MAKDSQKTMQANTIPDYSCSTSCGLRAESIMHLAKYTPAGGKAKRPTDICVVHGTITTDLSPIATPGTCPATGRLLMDSFAVSMFFRARVSGRRLRFLPVSGCLPPVAVYLASSTTLACITCGVPWQKKKRGTDLLWCSLSLGVLEQMTV